MIPLLSILFLILMVISVRGFARSLRSTPKPLTQEQYNRLITDLLDVKVKSEDPADDGLEVLVIRSEMMYAENRALYWRDPVTGLVLPEPMTMEEVYLERSA